MADIVAVYDDKPEKLEEGQQLFSVLGYWVVSSAGEPSPNEVKLFKLWELLDEKQVVSKAEMTSRAVLAEEAEVASIETAKPLSP